VTCVVAVHCSRLATPLASLERREFIHVQALVAQPAVERFGKGLLRELSWSNEVELQPTIPSPFFQGLRSELLP
jgi:hypothetical protein